MEPLGLLLPGNFAMHHCTIHPAFRGFLRAWVLLLPSPLGAAARAFVMLYALRLGGSYLDTLAMVPPLAYVAPNPELIRTVYPTTGSTKGFTVITVIFSICFVCGFSIIFYLTIMFLSRCENKLDVEGNNGSINNKYLLPLQAWICHHCPYWTSL